MKESFDRLMWQTTLHNLRGFPNDYLSRMRASCAKMLDDDRQGELARFMLDAVDHVLKERENNG